MNRRRFCKTLRVASCSSLIFVRSSPGEFFRVPPLGGGGGWWADGDHAPLQRRCVSGWSSLKVLTSAPFALVGTAIGEALLGRGHAICFGGNILRELRQKVRRRGLAATLRMDLVRSWSWLLGIG